MAIRHIKTDTIPDWTQPELDAQIALGNYPSGTVLADIVLPSDWNADHTAPEISDITGLQAALDAKGALTTVEKQLGSVPKMAGKFTIAGTGLTIGKPVSVMKAVGPYTGKGTRADEAEMDAITATGVVTSSTEITVYWNAATRVKGNVKFNYFVGA